MCLNCKQVAHFGISSQIYQTGRLWPILIWMLTWFLKLRSVTTLLVKKIGFFVHPVWTIFHVLQNTKKPWTSIAFSCDRRRSCCGGEGHLFWTQRAVFSSHVMCQAWPDTLPLYCHCSTLEELPSLQSNPSLPSSSCKLILSTHMEMVWLLLYRERVWDHVSLWKKKKHQHSKSLSTKMLS